MLIHYCVVYTSTQLTFTQSMFFRTYCRFNLNSTGRCYSYIDKKKMVLDDHHLICVLIYMKNYKESKIYNIIKCGILIHS